MKFRKIVLLILFFTVLITSLFPQNIYLLVLFSVLAWLLLPFSKWWDGVSVALLLFSIFYAVMVVLSGQMKSGFLTISYLIAPVAFYRFGHYLMTEYRTDNERFRLLLFVVYAYLLSVFVLTAVDISVVGIINEDRTLLGTSTNDDAMAATLYGLMTSVGIGCIGACFAKGQKLLVRLFYCILVILSLLVVIHLVNRGGLVVFIVCLMASLLINYRKSVVRLVFVISALTIGVVILLNLGILSGDVLDAYEKRNDLRGYGVESAGGRTELWLKSIENMFRYPMGWQQEFYAHNLWLDIARIGGWISFIPFLVSTLALLRTLLSLMRRRNSQLVLAMTVLNIALFLAAFIEPVLEGSISFFAILILVWGMTAHLYSETRSLN